MELPVSLPPPPSSKSPLVSSGSKPLIYKSSTTTSVPELATTLTIYPSLPASPRRIPYRINLESPLLPPSSPPDPTSSSVDSSKPSGRGSNDGPIVVSLGLCKHTWTKGIHTSLGDKEGHDFPGIMVGSVRVNDQRPDAGRGFMRLQEGAREGEMVCEGEFEVAEGEVTASGCGLRLNVSPRLPLALPFFPPGPPLFYLPQSYLLPFSLSSLPLALLPSFIGLLFLLYLHPVHQSLLIRPMTFVPHRSPPLRLVVRLLSLSPALPGVRY